MAMNSESGSLKGGDQPRMTQKDLSRNERGMGKISYTRQAQRGPMPRGGYGRTTRKS